MISNQVHFSLAHAGPLDDLVRLRWPTPEETATGVQGEVIHIDAFGNLVTSLPATLLPRLEAAGRLRVGHHEVATVVRTYGEAAPGTAVALVGSQGFIEAAVVEGRADERLSARIGTPVVIDADAVRSLQSESRSGQLSGETGGCGGLPPR